MIGGQYGTELIYDVTDPVHPRLRCSISGTSAHLSSGTNFTYLDPRFADRTNIVIRSFADGNESPAGVLPVVPSKGAWLPSGGLGAYSVLLPPTAASPGPSMQVWQYVQGTSIQLFTYNVGIADCLCRFGLPQQVLAVSPDGQYLVAGWASGKGGDPLFVDRLSDGARMITFDQATTAFWDRTGHRLFLLGRTDETAQSWTPEQGVSSLAGSRPWSFMAGLSPDGSQVAYTAYADTKTVNPRVYVYDLKAGITRMLIDKLRTQALFVKSGWVWYLEEVACDPSTMPCGPWGTRPTGKVFAMQLSTGTETAVSFATGENPVMPTSDVNWLPFTPGEFWPAV
jgi:WD40 repeat protein